MARPLAAQTFVDKVRALGVSVTEHTINGRSYRDHNRAGHGEWGDVNGVVLHHTGAYSSRDQIVRYCWDGSAALPGPLCHGVIDKSGVLHMVGWGRTNHAGGGDPAVLQHVIREDYDQDKELTSRYDNDDAGHVDGNAHFYGFEMVNNGGGKEAWTDAQRRTALVVSYAICKLHKWGARSVIAHREWQRGKPDPIKWPMGAYRDELADWIAHGVPDEHPPPPPSAPPTPKPPTGEQWAALLKRVGTLEQTVKALGGAQ